MNVSPRLVAATLALIALVPVALYQLQRPASMLALSVVSVFVIVGSLYLMFSPPESGHAA